MTRQNFYRSKKVLQTRVSTRSQDHQLTFLAQLMSCKLMLSLCDHPLSGVHPSVLLPFRPSVNFGGTNLDDMTCRVKMWSVDTLGEWLLPVLELGHSDLLCGFYTGQSSLFQCISMATRFAYNIKAFYNSICFCMPNY